MTAQDREPVSLPDFIAADRRDRTRAALAAKYGPDTVTEEMIDVVIIAGREVTAPVTAIAQHNRPDGGWCRWSGVTTAHPDGWCPDRCQAPQPALFCAVAADGVTWRHHLTISQAEAEQAPAVVVAPCPLHDRVSRPDLADQDRL